jgi:spore cortex biosynthesis protein YabQ
MSNQLYILISFFTSGLIIGLLFDVFRVTRRACRLPNIIIYIEDVLFWVITGVIIVGTILLCTDGQIRLYMILMMITGALFYFILISKLFLKINIKILDLLKNIFVNVLKPFKKIIIFLKNRLTAR